MMRRAFAAALSLLLATTPLAAGDPAVYDIVIRNGRVMDGAGKPWVRADVAISNGRITKVGRVAGKGAKEIDVGYRLAWPRAETGSHHLARLTTGFMIYSGA